MNKFFRSVKPGLLKRPWRSRYSADGQAVQTCGKNKTKHPKEADQKALQEGD